MKCARFLVSLFSRRSSGPMCLLNTSFIGLKLGVWLNEGDNPAWQQFSLDSVLAGLSGKFSLNSDLTGLSGRHHWNGLL